MSIDDEYQLHGGPRVNWLLCSSTRIRHKAGLCETERLGFSEIGLQVLSRLKIIICYFPVTSYAIVVLGVAYFIYSRIWKTDPSVFPRKSLVFLVLIILLTIIDVIQLTTPLLAGPVWVDSLPHLLMWIWPDIIVLVALVADMARSWRPWILRGQNPESPQRISDG
ncbi:MAG: hypothetical protein ACFFC0_02325 [Promethearchaeota archaeon]